jgi:hypothetical protein
VRHDTPAHVVERLPDALDHRCRHDALDDSTVLTTRRGLQSAVRDTPPRTTSCAGGAELPARLVCAMHWRGEPETKATRMKLRVANAEAAGAAIDRALAQPAHSLDRALRRRCHAAIRDGGRHVRERMPRIVMQNYWDVGPMATRRTADL